MNEYIKKPLQSKGHREKTITYIHKNDGAENRFIPVFSVLWDYDSNVQISFGGRGSMKSNDKSRRIVVDNCNGHSYLMATTSIWTFFVLYRIGADSFPARPSYCD